MYMYYVRIKLTYVMEHKTKHDVKTPRVYLV